MSLTGRDPMKERKGRTLRKPDAGDAWQAEPIDQDELTHWRAHDFWVSIPNHGTYSISPLGEIRTGKPDEVGFDAFYQKFAKQHEDWCRQNLGPWDQGPTPPFQGHPFDKAKAQHAKIKVQPYRSIHGIWRVRLDGRVFNFLQILAETFLGPCPETHRLMVKDSDNSTPPNLAMIHYFPKKLLHERVYP
jgi:hypothetical protein